VCAAGILARFIIMPKFDPCLICNSRNFKVLASMVSPVLTKIENLRVSICKDCGFVTVNPKSRPDFFEYANTEWFSKEAGAHEDETDRWEEFWGRVSNFVSPKKVLDVGPRYGQALAFIKKRVSGVECKAVELVDELRDQLIRDHGVDARKFNINQSWPQDFSNFDLVIMRMIVEHLDNPVQVLRNVAQSLTPGGLIYVSVPNSLDIRPGMSMRTGYFRPIHAHYFNITSLTQMMNLASLYPVVAGEDRDVWGLFGKIPTKHKNSRVVNFETQRDYLVSKLRESYWLDIKIIIKISLRQSKYIMALWRGFKRLRR